jgi:hypothetical protein
MPRNEISEIKKELHGIIANAFGIVLDHDVYMFLLWFLYDKAEMTSREVAAIIGAYIGKYYLDVIGDVYEVMLYTYQFPIEQMEKFESMLNDSGFDKWLDGWLKALNPSTKNDLE